MLGWRHIQRLGHRHAFAVMQQGDGQVVGHALLVVGEQHVAAGGQVGFLHQLLQVLHRLAVRVGIRCRGGSGLGPAGANQSQGQDQSQQADAVVAAG